MFHEFRCNTLPPVIKGGEGTPRAPSSVRLFSTTPFLSPSANLLTHTPSLLLLSVFFSQISTFSSHSIPHLSINHTLPFLHPSPWGLPTLSAHVWCPPIDQLQLGRAGQSDIITTGQERRDNSLVLHQNAPRTTKETEGDFICGKTGEFS